MLEHRAVDELKPLLVALCTALGKVPLLPPNFEGSIKMAWWLQKLHEMRAVERIGEEDARQLLMECEFSYAAFMEHLAGGGNAKA